MTVHIDLFWKDLSTKNLTLLATNAEFRTCPDELAFQASRKPIPFHYPLETKLLGLMGRFYNARGRR